jgi:probable phosphoglycerate mutase
MLIIYIRHGEPTYDPDGLTELGKQQAEAVATSLSIDGVDQIFSSTSNRAILTAKPTAERLEKEKIGRAHV